MSSMGQLMAPGAGESAGFNEGVAHLPSVPAQRFNAEEAVHALQGLGEGLNAARVVREELRSLMMRERLPVWAHEISTQFRSAVEGVLAPLEGPAARSRFTCK